MVRIIRVIGNTMFIITMLVILVLLLNVIQTNSKGDNSSILNHKIYYVDSGSMSPTIPTGSLIVVKKVDPTDIRLNDVITYEGMGSYVVTHRVMEIVTREESFITRGDANNSDDPYAVDSKRIVGKVVFNAPYIGYLLKFIQSRMGFLVIATLIILTVILTFISNKKRRITSKME
ncbi:signal peptidase I [Alkalibaculum sporogenes]|nr:signal peptidase I [Alkalibaculum sporogenes]